MCSTWSCSTSDSRLLELSIDHLNASGDGVAGGARQTITIPFTIPGERVRATVRRSRDGTLVGVVQDILRPSPYRVAPACPHFGPPLEASRGCGGCTLQHIAYPEQLRLKSDLVTRLVRAAVPGAPTALPVIPGTTPDSPWGYRQKAHFVFSSMAPRGGRARLVMGHYARGSRRVVPVTTCPVHDERGNEIAFRFRDAMNAVPLTGESAGTVKSLAVRVGSASTETMGTIVLTRDASRDLRGACRRVLDEGGLSSFHVNIHPRGDAYIFGAETRRISGAARMREEAVGVSFLISPTAFFQTNVRAAEVLIRLVVGAIRHPSRVLDLYAGAGLFALPLAHAGDEVVAIEENRESIADGEASRIANGIAAGQCRFIGRRVEDAVRRLAPQFDAVVFDPPRAGCSASVLEDVFGRVAPPLAVYVSCNPEALARDLRVIGGHGYRVLSLQPVDMFPHTAHVETVAVLQQQRAASPHPPRRKPRSVA